MNLAGLSLSLANPRGMSAAAIAPAVRRVVSPAGDSWTEENEQIISRLGAATPTASDGWTYQLAANLGVTRYTTPGQTGVTEGLIRVGYGGQKSLAIKNNVSAIIAGEAIRASDVWIHGDGRNDTPDAAGYANVVTNLGAQVALIPHDRQLIWHPEGYQTGVVAGTTADTASDRASWVRKCRLRWWIRDTYPKYSFELQRYYGGLYPNGADSGDATDELEAASDGLIFSMRTSAATDQAHPNWEAAPKWAAAFQRPVKACWNEDVYCLDQSISVPYNMAAASTIEVHFKGYVTSASIKTDDPNNPGLFTISMKPGSTDTALLTRTSTSPGTIPRILHLEVTATGVDTTGATKTHDGWKRIIPGLNNSGVTLPRGVRLDRHTHATASSRRWPFMASEGNPFLGSPSQFCFVLWGVTFDTDGENQHLIQMGSSTTLSLQRNTGNKIVLTLRDTAPVSVFSATATAWSANAATGPINLAFSIDLAGPTAHFWYWSSGSGDAVVLAAPTVSASNGILGLGANSLGVQFFAANGAQSTFDGKIKGIWMDTGRAFDFSSSTERRKFWDASGNMVDLGSTGAVDSVQPKVYIPGEAEQMLRGENWGSAAEFAFNDNWLKGYGSDVSEPKPYT